ncbi:DUF6705 family protein [Chryseobacterium sp. FH2]|uniref:DUF6705 family protein n=1 Tax=Chryseobacterium sp. FH2 TaxID=1674291 RepID=UPI000A467FFE|nr:DUF6705 family protein [Chryseobacterium sp. FH2]
MKKKKFLYLFIALISVACKAQQYSLNTDYENIPNNSHIKDLNNEYNKFVGTWKATLGNKEIYIYVTKQEDRLISRLTKTFFRDVLLIRYKVLISNQIVENTTSFTNENINIISMATEDNSVIFTYTGGKCTVGWGIISTEYIDSTHLKWNYQPQSTMITNKNCPDYPAGGIKINLPDEPKDLIFTKQ